ncbi:MAG TPA: AzlC family ABC transporter permease [Iamia sp.]|nr:AzlC family ABC transporter permease [Iamia sp.]
MSTTSTRSWRTTSTTTTEPTRRTVVADALAIGGVTGAYGISFGAVAVAAGLSAPQACVLSLLMFTGGSQFAMVGTIAGGGGAWAGAATAALLGVRNAFYGLELSSILRLRGLRRVGGAHLVIDESAAMGVAQPTPELGRLGFWATGAAVFVGWNAMTLVGAAGASALDDPGVLGLDVAGPAAFVALLSPRLTGREPWAVALVAAALALATAPLVPAGVPVLVAASVAIVVGLRTRGVSRPHRGTEPPEFGEAV